MTRKAKAAAKAPARGRTTSRAPAKRQAPTHARPPGRSMRARFDSAQTNDENRKHWAMADGLSADSATAPEIRRILRNRSRYEVANNTYAGGIVDTLANDTVGTGPRLQMLGVSRADATRVEGEFQNWCEATDLAEKLRTMRAARCVDGEAFALLIDNPELPTRVQLDLRLLEAEQVASSSMFAVEPDAVDGIRFDRSGNPVSYNILREHPGSGLGYLIEGETVPAERVLHYFVPKRPGQRRGIPELTPALPLFAQLRRWTLSVLAASETASDIAGIIRSTGPAVDEPASCDPFERVEIERRGLMTLPEGWDLSQLKAEQPVSGYAEFKKEIIGEIARCVSMPFNIAAGNSSGYNYSSGRLDHQTYGKALRVERARMRAQTLDRIFRQWIREAILIEGYLPQGLRTIQTDWSHAWFWDGSEHVDPLKEANAEEVRLASGTTTFAEVYGRQGKDWEEQFEQIAREKAKQRELGITPAAPAPAAADPQADPEQSTDGEDPETADDFEPADSAEAMRVVRDDRGNVLAIERIRAARKPAKRKAKK